MNKQQIFDAMGGLVSKTAIREGDDGYRVLGKYCALSPPMEGEMDWDLWIHNPTDLSKGLGTGKVNNLLCAVAGVARGTCQKEVDRLLGRPHNFRRYDGEAAVRLSPAQLPLSKDVLRALGIKVKKVFSEEHLAKMRENLR